MVKDFVTQVNSDHYILIDHHQHDLGQSAPPCHEDQQARRHHHHRIKVPHSATKSKKLVNIITNSIKAEVEFVHPVTAGGSVKFLPAV